jgi:hypothetical protein
MLGAQERLGRKNEKISMVKKHEKCGKSCIGKSRKNLKFFLIHSLLVAGVDGFFEEKIWPRPPVGHITVNNMQ